MQQKKQQEQQQQEKEELKFVADIMVGKLARYLRMTGKDVLYENNYSDEEILKIAKIENRIILTRDTLMLERKECKNNIIKSVLIKDDNLIKQLQQLKKDLKIALKPNLIRCLDCNTLLKNVKKEEILNKVPPYVYKTQQFFLYCPRCNKYYWRGTHYENIDSLFKRLNS